MFQIEMGTTEQFVELHRRWWLDFAMEIDRMVIFPRFRGHPRSHESAVGVFEDERKRRSFTTEFKAECVRLVREGKKIGKSAGVIARELDLTETALRAWAKQADIDEGNGPEGALTTSERQSSHRLI